MEGEDISDKKTVRQSRLSRVTEWQEMRSKRLHRWFRRLHRRIDARREYVRERDGKRRNE